MVRNFLNLHQPIIADGSFKLYDSNSASGSVTCLSLTIWILCHLISFSCLICS